MRCINHNQKQLISAAVMKLKLARTNIVMTLCFWVTERQVSVKTRRTSDAEARSVCPLDCPHQSPSSPTISPLWSSYKFVLHLFIYMRFFFSSLSFSWCSFFFISASIYWSSHIMPLSLQR